jgi:hypothetical protein
MPLPLEEFSTVISRPIAMVYITHVSDTKTFARLYIFSKGVSSQFREKLALALIARAEKSRRVEIRDGDILGSIWPVHKNST